MGKRMRRTENSVLPDGPGLALSGPLIAGSPFLLYSTPEEEGVSPVSFHGRFFSSYEMVVKRVV
jgi:hypothetical protein